MLALDPRVVDAVFTAIAAHLPPRPPDTHPLGCHRPRISDRDCFTGILIRLVTGCSWDVAARLSPAGETTLRDRRTEWLTAGVFDHLLKEALAAYDRIIGLDLSEVAVDGSLHKAPCGGEGTGPNPTDRAKTGWKWSVATDRLGIPVGWTIDGANRHDSILLKPTLQTVADRGLLTDIETLHLDRGYDSAVTTTRCTELGLTDVVCATQAGSADIVAKKPVKPNSVYVARSRMAGRRHSDVRGVAALSGMVGWFFLDSAAAIAQVYERKVFGRAIGSVNRSWPRDDGGSWPHLSTRRAVVTELFDPTR